VRDNTAWLIELFLLVLVLFGAIGLGLVATLSDSVAAEILSIFLFIVCLVIGIYFAVGQEERLRTTLFGAYVVLTALLLIFSLTVEGFDLQILTPLLG